MMKEYISEILHEAVQLLGKDAGVPAENLPSAVIGLPKAPEHGDYTSSVSFSLTKIFKKNPVEIGRALKEKITDSRGMLEKIDATSGHLNFFLTQAVYMKALREIDANARNFLKQDIGKGQKILLEFVSANPTGPLHVGHGRGAILGDTITRVLLFCGYNVTKEYYVNDAGSQVMSFAKSVAQSYFRLYGIDKEGGEYKGEYVDSLSKEIRDDSGDKYVNKPYEMVVNEFCRIAVGMMLVHIRNDLKALGIEMDSWSSEKDLYKTGRVDRVIEELKNKSDTYTEEDALWFSSSRYGDDKNRVLIRAGGEKTYFASDIAYHIGKFDRGYVQLINIWGADHHGYLPRIKAAIMALNRNPDALKVIFVQMVSLSRDGIPVQMSKRSGEFVTIRELVNEVKSDATRFFFLMRDAGASLNFDIELAKKQSVENPVYYIQYAHARICSVFRETASAGITLPDAAGTKLELLKLPDEKLIIWSILHFRDEIERAASTLEVHNISYYLLALANYFHSYYNKCRIINEDRHLTDARLVLVKCVKEILREGLALLGISAPERM